MLLPFQATHIFIKAILMNQNLKLRRCLREPIPEIFIAAQHLDDAVSAHLRGEKSVAEELFHLANCKIVWQWLDEVWGANSPYVQYRVVPNAPPVLPKEQRIEVRMPTAQEKQAIHERDGYHCRFCGIPVIRKEVRQLISTQYPKAVPWGRSNASQHAAFQAMWAQYDHILPHARGGDNSLDNVVLTCAACNFGRMSYTLEEVGILPLEGREPIQSQWDGLERFQ